MATEQEAVSRVLTAMGELRHWLYRTTDTDDDGAPLDFGVVSAPDIRAARRYVTARLAQITEPGKYGVRFYHISNAWCEGVCDTGLSMHSARLHVRKRADEDD